MLKKLGIALILVLGIFAVLVINFCYFRPFSIKEFYARSFLQVALDKPQLLTSLHILEQYGYKAHQSKLDDQSEAMADKTAAQMKGMLKTLESYDRSHFTAAENDDYDSFKSFISQSLEGATKWRYHNYPVNQLWGIQSEFPSFMDSSHQVHDLRDAQDYVTRLGAVRTQFIQVMQGLKIREEKGIIPPRFVIEKSLAQMNDFVAAKPEENILYQSLATKLKDSKIKEEDQARILVAAKEEITRTVYPAYKLFIDYFTGLLPKATRDDGVWKFPDGDAYYAFALRQQTTTDFTPDEIHQIGLNEVARIEKAMREIMDQVHMDPNKTVGALMHELGEDPRFLYPDNDAGREQILADYKKILDESLARMPQFFDVTPHAQLEVKRVPLFKEKTVPGAYYEEPAMDGTRPGTFYVGLYDIKAQPKFGIRTLANHEGIPGHHFQIALAQENKDLPFFRKILPFTAYVEGWGLYAEQLGYEAGLDSDPYDNLGRLQSELFRAVRLVVDTGIHRKHWTREQAIAYMKDHTGMAESDVVVEIERYIVDPGQACAYKMGMLKILELRKRAQDSLGKNFDIKGFHHVILGEGALPLFILERNVDSWIANQKTTVKSASLN